jgi:uncharacterized protein YodC (DUF2158 family)
MEKTPLRQILLKNDKTCFKCGKVGHPAMACPNFNNEGDTDSLSSQAKSVKKSEKEVKNMKKAFAQLKETKEDFDVSGVALRSHRQSTLDLICSPNLVKKIFRSSTEMQLKSNGGAMTVKHKAKMAGYHRYMWCDKKAILALSNVIKRYRVTYDSDDRMNVVVKYVSRQSTTLRTEP